MLTINEILDAAARCRTLADMDRVIRRLGNRLKVTLVNMCRACNLRATGTKGELLFRLEGVMAEAYLKANAGRDCGAIA